MTGNLLRPNRRNILGTAAISTLVLLLPVETSAQAINDAALVDEGLASGTSPNVSAGVASGDKARVVVRSYETAAISSEINARIVYLPPREGDRFRKNDVIVKFDCGKIEAEFDAASAEFSARKSTYDNQSQMKQYKFAGSLTVEQVYYEMKKAEAELQGIEIKRSACVIRAPFDGRVTEKAAQVYEVAQPNQPLMKIVNEDRLELVVMVPSNWLPQVTTGTKFRFKLDENGETHDATIVQSTGLIDPVSQSARLIAEIPEPGVNVAPGMSGTAEFPLLKAAK